MGFNTALSGLRAANQDLSVTGNNIANASTTGFKASRTEFGDVYANSILGTGSRTPGSGVLVADIAQQFDQGNISVTNKSLDLAISGSGFFVINNQGAVQYTRAGNFGLDSQGFIVDNNNGRLQGFPSNANGQIVSGALSDLRIQTEDISPSATNELNMNVTLDSRKSVPATTPFDVTDPTSYNWSTAATVYDSLGNPHTMTMYFVKNTPTAAGTDWDIYTDLDNGGTPNGPVTFSFDTSGAITSPTPASFTDTWPAPGGAAPLSYVVDLQGSKQTGAEFAVNSLDQDGYAPGRLAGVDIDDSGIVFARYTNGQALTLGQVALANFSNPQGLVPLGDTSWAESFDSGQPVVGAPQSGSLGEIQSGALEDSNVDLSQQLVNLIVAQRNFQANAKTIETEDTVTQAVINLR